LDEIEKKRIKYQLELDDLMKQQSELKNQIAFLNDIEDE